MVVSLLFGTTASGCSKRDTDAARSVDHETPSLAPFSTTLAGRYVVRSAARFMGDTLILAGAAPSLTARLSPPKPTPALRDAYTGVVTVVAPALEAPGTPGPQIEFALECYCRVRVNNFGQPVYEHVTLGGRYAVREISDGRLEFREVAAYPGGSAGLAVDSLERVR